MRIIFALLSLGALFLISFLLASSGASANHTGGMNAMSIDMEEEATPANTSSTLGSREICRRINEDNALNGDEDVIDGLVIDITARDVPPYNDNGTPGDQVDDSGGALAYGFDLNYSSANLTVIANIYNDPAVNLIASNPGSSVFNSGETTPDDENDLFNSAAIDTSNSPHESGSGVLGRLTIASEDDAASGNYLLTLTQNGHVDARGDFFRPDATNDAYVAIGGLCGDFDADGIGDSADACLLQAGPSSNNGCPLGAVVGGTAGLMEGPRRATDNRSQVDSRRFLAIVGTLSGVAAVTVAAGLGWRLRGRRAPP